MKCKAIVIVSVAVLLLCAAPLFAASKHSADIKVDQPLKVAATSLKPGDYKLEWQGQGNQVQVKFLQDGKVIATAPATIESNGTPYQDGFEARTGSGNSQVLQKIYLKKMALDFRTATGAAGE